ncbi:bifunctional YncE family protein/alkaline phosphatase family protein [Microbispora sp. KK1-11]|uniref:bifunctional YncE family protein/alkaline phosphatase family protein n=1 Tax=Microbispora sp. KK1-11 TaxID=2053005 RepID=UPI00115AAE01|nr:bifunctional YncE family protein/alkaline phosphatase family protein [Microbispora sp. KK1-11]TQS27097.1 bifunctional YncE family protein/alkaline phosphatase family protein [Microbispora sp. KK1-11]
MRGHGAVTRALIAGAGVTLLGIGVATAGAGVFDAGPRPRVEKDDGTAVIPVGYRVTPAGSQSRLGDLPLVAKPFPGGRAVLVVNAGQGVQSVQVVSPRDGGVRQTIRYASPQAVFAGAAFSPDGTKAYVSAGGNNKIRVYTVAGDRLTETTPIPLPVTNPDGQTINPYPAQIAVTPDGARLVVADHLADAATVITLADGTSRTVAVGHAPYGVTISPDGTRAYVTDQGAETVSVLDLTAAEPAVLSTITVGTHPNQSVLDPARSLLYVADGDSDDVSVVDTTAGRTIRTISLAPYRGARVGSNPDALALSPDGKTLYVADSGNNDVAVVDAARGGVRGLIPTGWYPTAVVSLGGRLLVTNAKGLGAGPNDGPGRPDPYAPSVSPGRYSGTMIVGTLSRISLPIRQDRLAKWTRQVDADNGFHRAGGGTTPGAASSVVPRRAREPSPIKHVIYVVRENRTFDQELGSIGKGDGDPSLNLFGDESAPNARALARRFVTIDNFYADAEVSAQGWNWVVAANSNPYSEQGWPANYSGRNHSYPSESDDPAIAPQRPDDAYIWQRLAKAGVSFRNYGFYVTRGSKRRFVAGDPVLDAHTDHAFTGFALGCPDGPGSFEPRAAICGPTDRFTEWKREFDRYVADGGLPAVEFVRLPNDHTAGTRAGSPTPRAYVGDNDWALGKLVESVSHSRYWKSTAVFVTEDDSQNGPDHVDAHRTVALVISPYTQTGRVDSTFYSTASMLRTIELFAGLRPLTQFDAYATPMTGSFTNKPAFTPYKAIRPGTMAEVNGADAPMAAQSAEQSLGKEDQIDEQVFNQAIWKSVKGDASIMPAPRHWIRGFVPGDRAGRHEDGD